MKKNTTLSEQFHNKNNLHDAEDASTIIQILDSIQGPGADPGFQVRGGALKQNCAERRKARKFLVYFV